jgi:hypothetical protein
MGFDGSDQQVRIAGTPIVDFVVGPACATARLPWPDRAPAIEPANVIMVTAEDSVDTGKPGFHVSEGVKRPMGCNCSNTSC